MYHRPMSRALGNQLPDSIVRLLDGTDLPQRWGQTLLLTTVDNNGFPHFAILTYGEILSVGPTELRIGMYPNSSTTRNMQARPEATLLMVVGEAIYYIKGRAASRPSKSEATVRFDITPEAILVDDEPGARITSGITFELATGKEAWLQTAAKTLDAIR